MDVRRRTVSFDGAATHALQLGFFSCCRYKYISFYRFFLILPALISCTVDASIPIFIVCQRKSCPCHVIRRTYGESRNAAASDAPRQSSFAPSSSTQNGFVTRRVFATGRHYGRSPSSSSSSSSSLSPSRPIVALVTVARCTKDQQSGSSKQEQCE